MSYVSADLPRATVLLQALSQEARAGIARHMDLLSLHIHATSNKRQSKRPLTNPLQWHAASWMAHGPVAEETPLTIAFAAAGRVAARDPKALTVIVDALEQARDDDDPVGAFVRLTAAAGYIIEDYWAPS